MKKVILAAAIYLSGLSAFAQGVVEVTISGNEALFGLSGAGASLRLAGIKGFELEGLTAHCSEEEAKVISQGSSFLVGENVGFNIETCKTSSITAIEILSVMENSMRIVVSYGGKTPSGLLMENYGMFAGVTCQLQEAVKPVSLSGFVKYVATSEIEVVKQVVCTPEAGRGSLIFDVLD